MGKRPALWPLLRRLPWLCRRGPFLLTPLDFARCGGQDQPAAPPRSTYRTHIRTPFYTGWTHDMRSSPPASERQR